MKKIWRRILAPAAVGAVLALVALPAAARPHGRGGGPHGFHGGFHGGPHGGPHGMGGGGVWGDMLSEHLDLSESQRAEIRSLFEAAHQDGEGRWIELAAARDELREASMAEPFAESAVRAAAQRLANAEAELAIHRAGVIAQVRQILTPEQRQKADELHERFRERRDDFREHRGWGGWGDQDDE